MIQHDLPEAVFYRKCDANCSKDIPHLNEYEPNCVCNYVLWRESNAGRGILAKAPIVCLNSSTAQYMVSLVLSPL